MKCVTVFSIILLFFVGCSPENDINKIYSISDTLNVAVFRSYDSEKLWDDIEENILKTYSIQLRINYYNDILQELDALESICQAHDIIIGLNSAAFWEVSDSLFLSHKPENLLRVDNEYIFDTDFVFIPLGFHYLGVYYHPDMIEEVPSTFGHLQDKEWKNQIIAPNCETTSTGRALLYWSVGLFEYNGYSFFWRSMKDNFYNIFDDYEDAMNRFLVKEVPFFFHGISSLTYDKFSYFIPLEGYYQLIEGMAISSFSKKADAAKSIVNLLLSEHFQELIADSNCLLPIHKKVLKQQEEFSLPNFQITNRLSAGRIHIEKDTWLAQWKRITKK